MNHDLAALRLFVRVAHTGSFSRAGRELGVSQPSVSRIIAALEQELGAALLTRSTRAVVLTDVGTDYLASVEPILDALEQANAAARGSSDLRGVLRVGVASSMATREIIPRLPEFIDQHPALRVELLMDDSRQDLLRDRVDVALRFGTLTDSAATARLIGVNPRLLAASPAYIARAGMPKSPLDLAQHQLVIGPAGASLEGWTFTRKGRQEAVRVQGRLFANVNEGAIAAAVAGLGIVSAGLWGCRAELASGALVRILSHWQLPPSQLHALFPAGRAAKPAARAFVDHVLRQFARLASLR